MKFTQINRLLKIFNTIQDKPMSVKLAYKLTKLKNRLAEEDEFYNTHLQEIITKYGELDDNGNFVFTDDNTAIKIKDGMTEACQKELDDLDDIDVVISDIHFTLKELDGLDLTINQMELLFDFIEE